MIFWGMVLPEYRAGDRMWPGRPVAGRHRVRPHGSSRKGRRDRSRSTWWTGQPAVVEVDALPGETFKARDRRSCRGWPIARNFFEIGERHASLRRHASVRHARSTAQGRRRRSRVTLDGKDIAEARSTCPGRRCSTRTARTTCSSRRANASSSARSRWSSAPRAAS